MPDGEVGSLEGAKMGTRWRVLYVRPPGFAPELRAGVEAVLDGIVAEMSQWERGSCISRFNSALPDTWHSLPSDFFTVLEAAARVAEESGGAFDPTIGRLTEQWGFGASAPFGMPDAREIERLRERVGWERLQLDPRARRAFQPGGVALDLAGIAKGYAVDRIARWMQANDIFHHLAEIGGEFVGNGIKPDGQPWWIDIEPPPGPQIAPLRIALHGLACATSGDYRRYLAAEAGELSHSINPRTGRPVANGVASVTVLHGSCMLADAWATALTIMGPEEGMAAAARKGLAAHMLVRVGGGFEERLSPALAAMLD